MESHEFIPIRIKANRDGFVLLPENSASFDEMFACLQQRLQKSRDFFRSAHMVLDLRFRLISIEEILSVQNLLQESCGARLVEVRLRDDLSFFAEKREQFVAQLPPPAPAQSTDDGLLIVRHTCRSGSRVFSHSDCLVLGDVNPGAEVIAVGDIIVFGTLRGMAHAGAGGDIRAKIWALSMGSSQLRIGDRVTVPPRGSRLVSLAGHYEVAEVRGESIEVLRV